MSLNRRSFSSPQGFSMFADDITVDKEYPNDEQMRQDTVVPVSALLIHMIGQLALPMINNQ